MGVERNLCVRLLTNLNNFSEVINVLIKEGYKFGENGKVISLSEDDIEIFDYLEYDSFEVVKDILNKRENKGCDNYIVIWDSSIDDSLLVSCTRLDNSYNGYKNHYRINFGIGHAMRIKGADRFTDFGFYLNKLIPILVRNSISICEINCSDYDY